MVNPLSKTPFTFLFIFLVAGILLQYYFGIHYLSIILCLSGGVLMLFSYFVPLHRQFGLRWLFGIGLSAFLIGVGIFSTSLRQEQSSFHFENKAVIYRGIVIDTPKEKKKSTAYALHLPTHNKKILCYFQRDSLDGHRLIPGDEVVFKAHIQQFTNIDSARTFDYISYMHNKGFAGSPYIPLGDWEATGNTAFSLSSLALKCRSSILRFYQSLDFTPKEYAILAALTLGYQQDLTQDIRQGFQTTGTVHVLSVSGLHVGIIFMMISFLLSFIPRNSRFFKIKPFLIILLLWVYAFITGLETPVVRASIMLSVFCVAELAGRKSYSIHNLFIAGFFMLLISPLSLFDIGFQLSFTATFYILWLHPHLSKLPDIKYKYFKKLWNTFSISLVAQLGTFPICLYYFGMFPTYFFAANMLIIPIVALITYGICLFPLVNLLAPFTTSFALSFFVEIIKVLVKTMTSIIEFFEALPFARIENLYISLPDLYLLIFSIVGFSTYLIYKKPKMLLGSLTCILVMICLRLYEILLQG